MRHASVSKLQTLQAAISVETCSSAPEIAEVCGFLTPAAVLTLYPQLDRWQMWQTLLIGTLEVAVQGTQGTQGKQGTQGTQGTEDKSLPPTQVRSIGQISLGI